MSKVLSGYTDLWGLLFKPIWLPLTFALGHADKVKIWLIGDLYKALLFSPAILIGVLYFVIFGFAPPTSNFLLLASLGAVLARTFSRGLGGPDGPRPIVAGFLGELSSMAGWTSMALVILTGVQLWLNHGANLSAAQFAEMEARVIDATARLREIVSIRNVLIVIGGLVIFALLFRCLKPLVAFGALRKTVSAILAVLAVLTQFSFVTASETNERRERIVSEIAPRIVSNATEAAQARKETAALRWAASEFAARPKPLRVQMVQELAALAARTETLCASARAEFMQAVQTHASESVDAGSDLLTSAEADANTYCNSTALFSHAVRPAISAASSAANAVAPDNLAQWAPDVAPPGLGPHSLDGLSGDFPDTHGLSIRDLHAMDQRALSAVAEARQARAVVREALVEGISDLLGPQYRGMAGKMLAVLQESVVGQLSISAENVLVKYWKTTEGPVNVTDDLETPKLSEEPHMAPLSEAHGLPPGRTAAQVADDVSLTTWRGVRAAPTAAEAAHVAVAALAVKASGLHGVRAPGHVEVPHVRVPRVRF